jgi:DNA-binding response OmpR family regulator
MSPRESRLLIVDDNEMNRDMLARRLSRSGYLVDVAENARQLMQHVKENGLDLVLLDIEMPEVSGFDALKMLRKDYSPSQLPIIMVTARNQREDIVRALNLGANDYLTKPVDFPVALARIATQLSRKQEEVSDQAATKSDLREHRYTPRYSFAADAEIVALKSGGGIIFYAGRSQTAGSTSCTKVRAQPLHLRQPKARSDRRASSIQLWPGEITLSLSCRTYVENTFATTQFDATGDGPGQVCEDALHVSL